MSTPMKTVTYWEQGCPECGDDATVYIVADKRTKTVAIRECIECKRDLRVLGGYYA